VLEIKKYNQMGWNIAGFAINRNYKNKIDDLSKALYKSGNKKLVQGRNKYDFERSATFGSTSGRMDFYFTEKGSFAFCNVMEMEYIVGNRNESLLQDTEMLTFAISETSMAFWLKYYVNGEKVREIFNVNGETKSQEGEPLDLEKSETDMTELIFGLVSQVIGKDFYTIEPNEEFIRFVKK
jgi:hypothetical protein